MNWLKKKIVTFILKKLLRKVFSMEKIRKWLEGKKTYLICLSTILGSIIAWLSNEIQLAEMIKIIAVAIVGITLKAGEARIEKKVTPKE